MIAASEPLEFVPHGRKVLANHPGKIYSKGHNVSASENSLLYKLTNFGIKDNSMMDIKDEEQEWWTIREVYYKSTEIEDTESETSKDNKFENESFRPPSRLKNDFNISIKSELMSGLKKDDLSGTSKGGSANSSSNMCKKFNLNCAQNKQPKRGLNPKTDCYYEEELYVKGCTAVWSKGLVSSPGSKVSAPEQRETICCYTIENPIKHAAFADFHIDIKNTMLIDALNSQIGDSKKNIKIEDNTEHIQSEVMPSILLIDNKCMRAYAMDGREYITSLPFQVKKVWPMKYGVLLEKDATPLLHNSMLPVSFFKHNESQNSTFSKSKTSLHHLSAKLRAESISGYDQECPLPTCFSLSHPLDEVTPILMKSPSQGLQYYNDGDLQIIFVSSSPSIILLYDWKLGTHSLWKIRKALRDECLAVCSNMNSTVFSQSCDFAQGPSHSIGRNSWLGSPLHSKKVPTTPTMSRQNSAMANIFHQQGLSPHASIGQASSTSMMANTMIQTPPALPLYPDVCINHIFTDSQILRRDPIEGPNDIKAFLHTDLVGHEYLCYMVKVEGVSKLQIMRLKKSHSHGQPNKTNIIVGWVSSVLAKDAVVLDHLKMIALIDEMGNIILQSGNYFVGKVHVGGVLARLIDSPYTKRATFHSPFPRRSSLLPTRCDTTFDDSALHLLSPVPHSSTSRLEQKTTLGIRGLRDACGDRVSVSFGAGALYRIALPPAARSPLLERGCRALAAALPKDLTMQVLIKWYGVRNAPGTQDLTPEQEWNMFSNLMLSLIGYDKLGQKNSDEEMEVLPKKQRTSSDGSQDDWEHILHSKFHRNIDPTFTNTLNLPPLELDPKRKRLEEEKPLQFNISALLFPYMVHLFYTFHLIYEDMKLNMLLENDMRLLSKFLYQISKDLCLDKYVDHYWLDYPTEFSFVTECQSQLREDVLQRLVQPNYFSVEPPNIFAYLNSVLKDVDEGYYPYIPQVNDMSKDIIEILSTAGCGRGAGVRAVCGAGAGEGGAVASSTPRAAPAAPRAAPPAAAVLLACERGITPRDVDNLPPAIALTLITIFGRCKSEPPADWPQEAYHLVTREDLALQAGIREKISSTDEYLETLALEVLEKETAFTQKENALDEISQRTDEDINGMEHMGTKLLNLLYPRDHRMSEVYSLLQSSKPVTINLTQRPEISDHDFIEEQEKYLYAIGTRTMALPVGRGMVALRTLACPPTDSLSLPKLCVSGRGPPPRCNTINLSANDTSPHCLLWPTFHNGVAAGLALVPMTGSSIDSNWIIFNKPRGAQDMSTEHAGFLLALGLNGHLRDMPYMTMYEYLIKCHEMISIGLLLGLAATFRGTMDVQATKMLSIHVEALLPPSSVELDIQHGILVAAVLGVGLLYQRTAHAHYAQVLLREIGKPPGPEMENCVEREGYALAAGLALGCVCLRAARGAPSASLAHLAHLAPALRTYMLGGERQELSGSQKERYKLGSYAVREGAAPNLDVTAPGATLALGLVYLQSGSAAVADWLRPPATAYLLDFVRPDLLMLRIIARGLVLWDSIEPTEEWVESQVPPTIRPYCFVKPTDENVDYEAMNQAYCNIIAGACFALGLRFAGSGDEEARDTALYFATRLASAWSGAPELAGASTLETCCCVCLLAAGMIMSGRGDIAVMRLCRRLRARTAAARPAAPAAPPATPHGQPAHPPLTHGAQMAVHCTLGLLFLGGGRATLASTPEAVAALIIAFFPKFPTHTEDNRYHLQAFRHLYVLAVENRLLLPRDIDTGKLCYAHIQVVDLEGAIKEIKAPCLLPELDKLKEVKINDPRYWPMSFQRDRNWDQLKTFLEYTWCVDIKQRAGCLSYCNDPQGFLTMLGQTLTLDQTNIWSAKPDNIDLFTNDAKVKNFIKHYLTKDNIGAEDGPSASANLCADCLLLKKPRPGTRSAVMINKECVCRKYSRDQQEFIQNLSVVTYECVVNDMLRVLPIWTTFLKIIKSMRTEPRAQHAWQVKLLLSQARAGGGGRRADGMPVDGADGADGGDGGDAGDGPLASAEFTLALQQRVGRLFDQWELKMLPFLRKYLGMPSSRTIDSCRDDVKRILATFLVYHDLRRDLLRDSGFETSELALVMCEKANLSGDAVSKVLQLLR